MILNFLKIVKKYLLFYINSLKYYSVEKSRKKNLMRIMQNLSIYLKIILILPSQDFQMEKYLL